MNKRTLLIVLAAIGIPLGSYVIVKALRGTRPTAVPEGDFHMETAIAQAQNSVDTFIAQLADPQQNWRYLVKFRIAQEGHVEHMWAEPVAYKNGMFRGIIINDPYMILSIKKGDTYSAPKRDISDWMIVSPEGDRQGGWTEDAL